MIKNYRVKIKSLLSTIARRYAIDIIMQALLHISGLNQFNRDLISP
jgi:hypothetical protein